MMKINKELLLNTSILYVEDEEMIREELSLFFKKRVKFFYMAKDGIEGLEMYKKFKPDIIITDIQMPRMNGLEMIEALGKSHAPVIITTAYSDASFFLKAIKLKVTRFVLKPMNLIELITHIQDSVINMHLKHKLFKEDYLLDLIDENVLLSITDEKGIITDVSNSFCEYTKYSKNELIGSSHKILRHEDTSSNDYKKMWDTISTGKVFTQEIKNKRKDNKEYWSLLTITPVFKNEKIVNYTSIRQDITTKKQLELLAISDDMTKLYNRRHFDTILEKEIRRSKRDNGILCLVCFDIDNFKEYNDLYGHPSGDEALIKISSIFKNHTLRASDYSFRLGGEEFALILKNIELNTIVDYIKKIVNEIESLEIEHQKNTCSEFITISAGAVIQEGKSIESFASLYRYSDEALYQAKKQGRNRLVLSKESL